MHKVLNGTPIIGLYPLTNPEFAKDFEQWKAEVIDHDSFCHLNNALDFSILI